jgi:hypothetical protein
VERGSLALLLAMRSPPSFQSKRHVSWRGHSSTARFGHLGEEAPSDGPGTSFHCGKISILARIYSSHIRLSTACAIQRMLATTSLAEMAAIETSGVEQVIRIEIEDKTGYGGNILLLYPYERKSLIDTESCHQTCVQFVLVDKDSFSEVCRIRKQLCCGLPYPRLLFSS